MDSQNSIAHSGYTFTALEEETEPVMSSKILSFALPPQTDAQIRARLLTLFGAPLYETDDDENAYGYIIRVTDQNQNSYILTAYQGATGAAIGGDPRQDQDEIKKAAQALRAAVEAAEPSDFEKTVYYFDTLTRIDYGCCHGNCYSVERQLTFEELSALYPELSKEQITRWMQAL